jgi:hypothetical protein
VIVVRDSDRVRDVLEPVYGAMDVAWNPATAGSVEDELGAATRDEVAAALRAELQSRFDVTHGDARTDDDVVAAAASIEARFRVDAAPERGALATKLGSRDKLAVEH